MRAREHEYIIILYFVVFSVFASIPGLFYDFIPLENGDWLLLLGVAAGTLGGQIFMTRGLHLVKAAKATHISYSNVLFTILWGSLIWDKFPNLLAVFGIIIIIFSIFKLNDRDND